MKQIGGNPYRGLNAWMAEYDRKEQETVDREWDELVKEVSRLNGLLKQLSDVNLHLMRRLQDEATQRYQDVEAAKMVWAR